MATKMTYGEQLKHPNWQKKRLEILNRDEWSCRMCYDDTSTLHVHHKHYVKGRMAWEYSDQELVTLCESCHEAAHEDSEEWKMLLAALHVDGPYSKPEAFALVSGWAGINESHAGCGGARGPSQVYLAGQAASSLIRILQTQREMADLSMALEKAPLEKCNAALKTLVESLQQGNA